jgi:hypothetical protein
MFSEGTPPRFTAMVSISLLYMAMGLPDFSPILKAVVGDVGCTMRSTSEKN